MRKCFHNYHEYSQHNFYNNNKKRKRHKGKTIEEKAKRKKK
jgi:hypothetical protein